MAKLIKEEDGFYRIRRGEKVRIPDEWVGQVPNRQTVKKRNSHQTRHQRDNESRTPLKDGTYDWKRYRSKRFEMLDEEA